MTPEDHSGGPVRCEQLGPFVDGELAPDEAAAFRKHLLVCARCQQEMHGLMQLSALAAQARIQPGARKAEVSPVAIAAADRRARPRRAAWMGMVGAVAIAAALVLALRGQRSGPDVPALLASLDARTVSGWPSAMGPGQYRAYQTMRGTTAPTVPDALAQAQLRFEATGDLRALATVSLLRRDFASADARLASLPQTPDVLADRGLVRLEQSRCGEALEFLDRALFEQPENLPARFNRALCLKQLRLPFAAERALAPVASSAAGGWSAEAKQEEQRLDRTRADFVRQEEAAHATREALVREQTPLPDAFIAARPSQSRIAFYHAVSSAPGRAELERLRGTAQALDRAFGTQDMERRLDRVLRTVRPERSRLALEYRARILEGKPLPAAEVNPLRDAALKTSQDDIAIQLIDQFENLDVSPLRERLARASGDPWHAVRLVTAQARGLMERGRAAEAERVLRAALDACRSPSMAAACWYGQEALGDLYVRVGRPADARRVYSDASLRLQASALYPQQRKALMEVARITAMAGEVALARATFEELQLREPERCIAWGWARELIAQGHVRAHDAARAKATVQEPISCTIPPEPWRDEWRLDLGRLQDDP
ncbi:MAG TPA: zf-HC2 domain-containing protein, partial [Myxococcaceae bacterium]|nr:zf-HC2 domain-containing protein [Myxococcaceae bacterium]